MATPSTSSVINLILILGDLTSICADGWVLSSLMVFRMSVHKDNLANSHNESGDDTLVIISIEVCITTNLV